WRSRRKIHLLLCPGRVGLCPRIPLLIFALGCLPAQDAALRHPPTLTRRSGLPRACACAGFLMLLCRGPPLIVIRAICRTLFSPRIPPTEAAPVVAVVPIRHGYLLPLNGRRRLARDVINDAVHPWHLIDNAVGDPRQHIVRQPRPVRSHEVAGG